MRSAERPAEEAESAGASVPGGLLEDVVRIARDAGEVILGHYASADEVGVRLKKDDSPLTEADLAAHQLIAAALNRLEPRWPILSEESVDSDLSAGGPWQKFWLVDPLDGTREFIKRTNEFTVNIALIENDRPVLGVVYAPVAGECYFAARGCGAWLSAGQNGRVAIQTRRWSGENLEVVVSRSHPSPLVSRFLRSLPWPCSTVAVGSSLKLCLIAQGRADIYPRLGPTSLWDIAAAECVVAEAGGQITDLHGNRLLYRPADNLINPFFLVSADADFPVADCLQLARELL